MGGHHHHHHHGHHHHHSTEDMSEKRLSLAIGANIILTLVQIIGGLASGSLSLIADALHNFSDAASLLIALVAVKIGRRPADKIKTFGYKRAETIAALVNLTTLIIIGLYLIIEAVTRFFSPEPIEGWTVIIVAGIALSVDLYTAALTWKGAKTSMNMKAAFLHNITDALASVGVIIAGTLILLYGWVWVDTAMTLLIAGYVLYHGFTEMPRVIHLLMDGVPDDINIDHVITAMEETDHVINVHHVHIRRLDEQRNALEAHVVLPGEANIDDVKTALKTLLKEKFSIHHATLEFENTPC